MKKIDNINKGKKTKVQKMTLDKFAVISAKYFNLLTTEITDIKSNVKNLEIKNERNYLDLRKTLSLVEIKIDKIENQVKSNTGFSKEIDYLNDIVNDNYQDLNNRVKDLEIRKQ